MAWVFQDMFDSLDDGFDEMPSYQGGRGGWLGGRLSSGFGGAYDDDYDRDDEEDFDSMFDDSHGCELDGGYGGRYGGEHRGRVRRGGRLSRGLRRLSGASHGGLSEPHGFYEVDDDYGPQDGYGGFGGWGGFMEPMGMESDFSPQAAAQYRHHYATNDRGAGYQISNRDLQELQDPNLSMSIRPLPRPIPMHRAGEQLRAWHPIKRTVEYRNAWNRILETHRRRITWEDWDLLIKMFNDIDTAIFHGDLKSRVYLQWINMYDIGKGHEASAFTYHDAVGWNTTRIMICMGTELLGTVPKDQIMAVLVHEMLHAYLMVWCRDSEGGERTDPRRGAGHGPTFMECARWIEDKLDLDLTIFD